MSPTTPRSTATSAQVTDADIEFAYWLLDTLWNITYDEWCCVVDMRMDCPDQCADLILLTYARIVRDLPRAVIAEHVLTNRPFARCRGGDTLPRPPRSRTRPLRALTDDDAPPAL